jgi:hypothetical protein
MLRVVATALALGAFRFAGVHNDVTVVTQLLLLVLPPVREPHGDERQAKLWSASHTRADVTRARA